MKLHHLLTRTTQRVTPIPLDHSNLVFTSTIFKVKPATCHISPYKSHLTTPFTPSVFHHILFATMSSGDQQFPPQKQDRQPGKEHVMDPIPQYMNPNYKPADKLRGKVALVTGGDSGIGRAICYCFAKEGATIALTYVKGQEDKDATDTIKIIKEAKTKDSKDPIAIATDLGYDANCKSVVDEVVGKFGRIDILINNAAEQYTCKTVEEIDEKWLDRVFRTNIYSYFFLTRHALKHMKEGSSIINTTSVNAYKGNATLLDYTSTKGAIVAFTRGLALQLAQKNIRVNGVAPGPVWTPLIPSSFNEEKTSKFGSECPMNRAGQPYEIAPSYVFLASEDSSYFTGQVLHPNGGMIVNA
ncbi:putative short-chain dehydrogenase/reductase SDR, NAD(P)-binding domain superfamily [Helianthus annuus]|nr:putative short-chain dehydrogenase/reductase SDR, NAD(P)-binding domain superfamily [Helianthus annuus]